jgi:hypothetical protein
MLETGLNRRSTFMILNLNEKEREVLGFLAQHLFYGLAGGLAFGAAVLFTNLGNIRVLALDSAHPVLVLVLFFFGLCVSFGSVGMGVGIMNMARDDERELE